MPPLRSDAAEPLDWRSTRNQLSYRVALGLNEDPSKPWAPLKASQTSFRWIGAADDAAQASRMAYADALRTHSVLTASQGIQREPHHMSLWSENIMLYQEMPEGCFQPGPLMIEHLISSSPWQAPRKGSITDDDAKRLLSDAFACAIAIADLPDDGEIAMSVKPDMAGKPKRWPIAMRACVESLSEREGCCELDSPGWLRGAMIAVAIESSLNRKGADISPPPVALVSSATLRASVLAGIRRRAVNGWRSVHALLQVSGLGEDAEAFRRDVADRLS